MEKIRVSPMLFSSGYHGQKPKTQQSPQHEQQPPHLGGWPSRQEKAVWPFFAPSYSPLLRFFGVILLLYLYIFSFDRHISGYNLAPGMLHYSHVSLTPSCIAIGICAEKWANRRKPLGIALAKNKLCIILLCLRMLLSRKEWWKRITFLFYEEATPVQAPPFSFLVFFPRNKALHNNEDISELANSWQWSDEISFLTALWWKNVKRDMTRGKLRLGEET